MTRREARALPNGLYRLTWKSGGFSVASVGRLEDGTPWFAPSNWTSARRAGIASTRWRLVRKVDGPLKSFWLR